MDNPYQPMSWMKFLSILIILTLFFGLFVAVQRMGFGKIIEATPLKYLMPRAAEAMDCTELKKYGMVCVAYTPPKHETHDQWLQRVLSDLCDSKHEEWGEDGCVWTQEYKKQMRQWETMTREGGPP